MILSSTVGRQVSEWRVNVILADFRKIAEAICLHRYSACYDLHGLVLHL